MILQKQIQKGQPVSIPDTLEGQASKLLSVKENELGIELIDVNQSQSLLIWGGL